MRSEKALLLASIVALAGASTLNGCARTVADSFVQRDELRTDELEFLAQLDQATVVTNDDALHALFLFQRGEDPFETYEERANEARRLGWIPLSGDFPPPNESATVGMVSVAIARITGVRGGLTMRVLGPTPRAATREMIYLNVLPDRTENQALTGPEFIEFLGRADRLLVAETPLDVEESLQRLEGRSPDDLPESVRDVQQQRQRAPQRPQ
jgi:hypothetical protein